MKKAMTMLLDKCENRLACFYDKLKKNPKKEFAFGLLIYTVIFAVIAAGTLGKVMYRTGTIAGTDGSAQYFPMLIDFRHNLRHIFKSISEGQFSVKMMNFDFMFGSDTVTSSTMFFLPFLPVYILAAVIPEEMLGTFYGIVTILLSYICGLTFMLMCRHFKTNVLWSGVFAPTYAFCGNYIYTIMWNQQFLYAMLIFPIMIIGIDRILHNKSCTLFTLCISYLFLSGFVSIIYTLPFVVLFAAVHLYFIDSTKYFIKLLKYFAKGVLCTLLGMLLSAFSLFPYLYLFFNTSRSTGTPPDIKTLVLPSSKYISDILYSYDINGAIGLRPVLVFFLFFCIFSLKAEKKHKILSAIGLLIFSLPLIWYGLNGFLYDLCRWGYIPSCMFAYIAAIYAPKVFRLSKKELFSFTLIFAFFLIAIPFHLEYVCFAIMLLFTVASSIDSIKNKSLTDFNRLKSKIKINNPKLKRYFMMASIIVSVLVVILICEVFIVSPYYDVSKGVFYIFISLLLIFLASNIRKIQQ